MLACICTMLASRWLVPSRICFPINVATSTTMHNWRRIAAAVPVACVRQSHKGTQLLQSTAPEPSVMAVCRTQKSGPSVFFRPVVAAWGDVQWETAKVSERRQAASGLQLLRVDLGGLVDGYTTAGQFIQMRVGEKKAGFFAIASPPDKENRGPVEVLVKDNAPETTAHDLCRIEPGTDVEVTAVMGKGFRPERAPAQQFPTCFIFATGSGISPIKALIESNELETSERQRVKLYYGTSRRDTTAYTDLQAGWKAEHGVETVNVFSDDGKGYIQNVFQELEGDFEGSKTCAVLVGQKEMCEAITKFLESKGVSKDHIMLNF